MPLNGPSLLWGKQTAFVCNQSGRLCMKPTFHYIDECIRTAGKPKTFALRNLVTRDDFILPGLTTIGEGVKARE